MGAENSSRLKSFIYLASGFFGVNFALAIYQSTYTNFLVDDLKIDAFQVGALESIREIPGLLSAFILGSIIQHSQTLLAGIFILIFGTGIGGVSMTQDWLQVVLWSLVWSIGFHSWTPLSYSIALKLSEPKREGGRLGQLNSVSSIAAITAMAAVTIFSSTLDMEYRTFFLIAGLISVIGGVMVFRLESHNEGYNKTRLVFRGRYNVFYILSFLEGARRQMFLTFAPFTLVKVYGLSVTSIALLMFTSRALTLASSPFSGRMVDRLGARTMLILSYVFTIGTFLGYAYIHNVYALLALYALNSILTIISRISRTTYINQISDVTDLTPSLAMGQTIEHIAAVLLPLTGGIIWEAFGYEVTFLIGVACAILLLLTAQRVRTKIH